MASAQILVVEDEGLVARDIQRSLVRWGYSVPAVVPSGEEAVEKAEELHPDLVLMDIRLKGTLSGIEAGERLRNRHDMPIVFLTAYADDAMLARAKDAEPFGYLVKPFEERELRATVEMALHKHRLESFLRDNEQWLASILEFIGDGVIVTDAAGSIEVLNPAAERLTGFTCMAARGQGLRDVFAVTREGSHQPFDPAAEAFRKGGTVELDTDVWLCRRDGRRLPIEGSVALLDDAGTFTGFAVAFRDVSRRRHAERQALAWQKRHLQRQKREALARLAGGVASDFNNMLTIITGYSDLLLAQATDEPTRSFLKEIGAAADRAATVARQLQAFSGGQLIMPVALDLNDLLTRLEKVFRRLGGDGVDMVFRLDPDLQPVRADPLQMEQVLLDLIVNACEAMDGRGLLNLQTSNVLVDEEQLQPDYKVPSGSYVMLTLSHSGPPLDDEAREHLFEPYFTAVKGDRPPGPGLATVYGILKQSGGYIEAVNEGTRSLFRLYLPAESARQPAQPPATVSEASLQGTETLLLVEDDAAVRGVAVKVLRRAGYKVLEASGGAEALRICQTHDGFIHLLITDMMMQGMTGSELARTIQPLRKETRPLFLSGHWVGALVQDGLLDPSAVFLQKPFSSEALLRAVRDLLDRPAGT
jgi:PAS domain S-box-containing protein